MYVMTHHFVNVICIVIFEMIILVTFSYDILDIHAILSLIVDAIWMKN
jgi:hypothetical protein